MDDGDPDGDSDVDDEAFTIDDVNGEPFDLLEPCCFSNALS